MTYAISHALQEKLFDLLSNDGAVTALVGTNVFDAPPKGNIPDLYVLLGDELVKANGSKTHDGAIHDLDIRVVSDLSGFSKAKKVAAAVGAVLEDIAGPLAIGRLIGVQFRGARAERGKGRGIRQITLKFRAFVEDG